VVVGGFIGLEMVENPVHRGLVLTLSKKLNHVMPSLDPQTANLVQRYVQGTESRSNSMMAWLDSGRTRTARRKSKQVQAIPIGRTS